MLLTDRDEISNLHRGHTIDASYQVSVHLADLPTKILDENINLNRIKKNSRLMDGNV
jgi:hypothetical protein